ncbi:Tn3 family transposase [Streptosporangium canum]
MPVEFLTDEQAASYGKFNEEPTRPELERFFFLLGCGRGGHMLAGLSLDMPVEEHLAELVRGLDAGWKQLAERLEEAGPAAKVSIEVQDDGRVKLNVDKLGALGEPKSLTWLRKRVEKMLPKIDLPDLLFEVNAWTGFLDAFVHLGDGTTRMKDLSTSVVALLVPEACNIGLAPVVNPGYEALTRARLVHVDQYYPRADTIAAANARLIAAQAAVPTVKFWGEGLLASVDGLWFVVPVRTVSAAPPPKYFGFKRGITWLNAVNDQVAGIGQMVVPGTPRDSLHILDALLNLDGGVKPEVVATDNASYSDMVFGLFKILGYNFSPRFRDLDDQRFWRATMPGVETGTYGALEDLARNRVNLNKVITHWPDLLKVAGSLVTNQVRAYDLPRMFGREGRPARWVRRSRSTGGSCSGPPGISTLPSTTGRRRPAPAARPGRARAGRGRRRRGLNAHIG